MVVSYTTRHQPVWLAAGFVCILWFCVRQAMSEEIASAWK